jgi:trehalose-phosphatase
MHTLNAQSTTEQFLARLAEAPHKMLLLDYDGTIAPFTPNRHEARAYPQVADILQRILHETNTQLVMVSGRPAWELRSLLPLNPIPEIWGSHGLERLHANGDYQIAEINEKQCLALNYAGNALARLNLGVRLEYKAASRALHLRGLTPAAAQHARHLVLQVWEPIVQRSGLQLIEFDGGLELKIAGHNKGDAVRTLLNETGESSAVAYLGDDQTDEDAFRGLRPQDLGVLVRPEIRETSAKAWIKPPEELHQFLGDWLLACGGVI